MLEAVEAALPADVFIAAAAVADWRAESVASHKIKKGAQGSPTLRLVENPDILAEVCEEDHNAAGRCGWICRRNRKRYGQRESQTYDAKGCDLIVANSVAEGSATFGGEANQVEVIDAHGVESWPPMSKDEVADGIVRRLALELAKRQ